VMLIESVEVCVFGPASKVVYSIQGIFFFFSVLKKRTKFFFCQDFVHSESMHLNCHNKNKILEF